MEIHLVKILTIPYSQNMFKGVFYLYLKNLLCLFDIENKNRFRMDQFNWNFRPIPLFIFSLPFLEGVVGSTYKVFRPI